jgi:hypothetical protein
MPFWIASCAIPPSSECSALVACQTAFDDSVDVSAYAEGGACWQTLQTALQCTEQCKVALVALRAVPDVIPECAEAP